MSRCFTLVRKWSGESPQLQNLGYWTSRWDDSNLNVICHSSPKINVWMGISASAVYGPFFIEGNITGINYLDMLEKCFIPPEVNLRAKAIFQQDGAPAHYSSSVREFLDRKFPNRWLGRALHQDHLTSPLGTFCLRLFQADCLFQEARNERKDERFHLRSSRSNNAGNVPKCCAKFLWKTGNLRREWWNINRNILKIAFSFSKSVIYFYYFHLL